MQQSTVAAKAGSAPTLEKANPFIHRHDVDAASLTADAQLFDAVVLDMRMHGKRHLPAPGWIAAGGGPQDKAGAFTAARLIEPWVGFGATKVTAESLFWYYPFLNRIDGLGLVPHYFESDGRCRPAGSDLTVADLGTLLDINLATAFVKGSDTLRVVEVGGGYGRLAEAFLNVFEGGVKYLLVDAVPSSLVYAHQYLARSNPGARLGSYYRGDPLDWRQYDCYIAPVWHLEDLTPGGFELAINVQSMQEMQSHHVDFYLRWFDDVLCDSGVAYSCNRRDHIFRGEWRYPAGWECLLKTCTPRSWTRDFPAEIFRKTRGTHERTNRLREALYQFELEYRRAVAVEAAAGRGYSLY
jgi:hypothetical protein